MTLSLQARKLACERDDRWLFEDLDLDIRAGEIVRIEGPNGSGKTTLLKILSGQLADYRGELFWNGMSMRDSRQAFLESLLYLGHAPGVKGALTPLENLTWYQALAGERDNEAARLAALESVGLVGFEDVPAAQLSAGQQRRVALARLELTPRPLWVLDEPFTAIDRDGVAALEERLIVHARAGGCVLVTTHHELRATDELRRVHLGMGRGGQPHGGL
ncbi:cytochrome c biogenesis heme-transporting ATPase CcmA [Halomonas sp. HK25]|uniref:cytochrome c biogenesis heme-transporting ATPase CcmA n=1 Tax=Halomonas sp. HK25 TaxID=3394321 RepID=UPI0039FBA3FE